MPRVQSLRLRPTRPLRQILLIMPAPIGQSGAIKSTIKQSGAREHDLVTDEQLAAERRTQRVAAFTPPIEIRR